MDKKREEATEKIEVSQDDATQEGQDIKEEKTPKEMSNAELIKKLDEFREKSEKNYDQYLRAKAEIDNIIKRNKKDKEEWIKYSNETLIKELLPVIDNLEKAILHSSDENALTALREGVALTLKGLKSTLAKSGLEEIVSEGKSFDPSFHHAVMEQEDEEIEAGMIVNELQKGYSLNKRLIRPAMVIISKGRPKG